MDFCICTAKGCPGCGGCCGCECDLLTKEDLQEVIMALKASHKAELQDFFKLQKRNKFLEQGLKESEISLNYLNKTNDSLRKTVKEQSEEIERLGKELFILQDQF